MSNLFFQEWLEVGAIVGAAIFIVNVLVLLSCYWSVHCLAINTCSRVSTHDLDSAQWVKVVPTDNNGSAEMVRLARTGPYPLWFMFQKLKFVWDSDKKVFTRVQFPTDHSMKHYRDWTGWGEEQEKK